MKDIINRCECTCVHEKLIGKVKDKMPEDEKLYDLADLFKKALTIAPDDTLLELEKEWSEVKTPVGRSVMKFIKEEQERRKADRG